MSDQVWNNGNIWQTICPQEFVAMIVGALITTLSSHLSRVAPCHDLKHCLLLMGNRLLSRWRVSLFGEGTSLDWRREVNCRQGEISRAWWQEFSKADAIQWGNHLHTSFISLFIILCWYCLTVTVYKVLFCVTQVKVVIPGWPALVSGVGDELAPVLTRGWWWGGRLPLEHHFHNGVEREVAYFSLAQWLHLKSSPRWRESLFHACTHY